MKAKEEDNAERYLSVTFSSFKPYVFNEDGYALNGRYGFGMLLERYELEYIKRDLELDIEKIKKSIEMLDENNISDLEVRSGNKERYDKGLLRIREKRRYENERPKRGGADHLYLFVCKELNCLKIGRSRNPKARLRQLNTSSPYKIESLFILKNLGSSEAEVHNAFSSIRKNSEWFEYSEDVINYFKDKQE